MNTRRIGAQQEERAAVYLQQQGMEILERNFRNRQGEIDIIGRQGGYLVFVEVKYRSGSRHGLPSEAVDLRKQKNICRVADYYRMRHQIGDGAAVRYDVVAIENERIEWIRNAFCHMGR